MQLFKKYATTCDKFGMREEPKIIENVKNAKVKKLRSVNMIHKKVKGRKLTPATIGSEIKIRLKKQRSANGYSNYQQWYT